MLTLRANRVTQAGEDSGEDVTIATAIRVHDWVESQLRRLAKAIEDLEHGPFGAIRKTVVGGR